MTVIRTIDELASLPAGELGATEWTEVTQAVIDGFADLTGDHQWVHVDPERAERESPYGRTIAHGYYTLSLLGGLIWQFLAIEDASLGLNYGLNRVRFPSPLPVRSRIRLVAELKSVTDIGGGVEATIAARFEIQGQDKPACAAEALFRYYR